MIRLLTGSTHTGKTLLAQRLLERHGAPYLSIDHLKMGLIRSGMCPLTPESTDEALTAVLWPVVREIVKTAVENGQSLTVEGCYIPFNWREDFDASCLPHIRFLCLVFSEAYIRTRFDTIQTHANAIERRKDDSFCTMELLLAENRRNLEACLKIDMDAEKSGEQLLEEACRRRGLPYYLIDGPYAPPLDW